MGYKRGALYVVAVPQGISGFRAPAIVALTTGYVAKRDLLSLPTRAKGRCADREWRLEVVRITTRLFFRVVRILVLALGFEHAQRAAEAVEP